VWIVFSLTYTEYTRLREEKRGGEGWREKESKQLFTQKTFLCGSNNLTVKRALNREWKGKGRRLWKAELSENNEDTRGNLTPGPSSPWLLAAACLLSAGFFSYCYVTSIAGWVCGSTYSGTLKRTNEDLGYSLFFFFDLSLFSLSFLYYSKYYTIWPIVLSLGRVWLAPHRFRYNWESLMAIRSLARVFNVSMTLFMQSSGSHGLAFAIEIVH
jgi:hypothetical protein